MARDISEVGDIEIGDVYWDAPEKCFFDELEDDDEDFRRYAHVSTAS